MELVRAEALASGVTRAGSPHEATALGSALPSAPAAVRSQATRLSSRRLAADETLVPDCRAALSPAQTVERRLAALLKDSAVGVSHVRMVAHLSRK